MAVFQPITLLLICLLVNLSECRATDHNVLRVMTFNIRYGTAPDKENAWPLRRDLLFKVVHDAASDIIGLQEALRTQLDELTREFPQYASLGVGREANGGGEYSAILYDSYRFDVRQADTFWLSAKPEETGSATWGNELPRVCTWARLFDLRTQQTICVLNTHWDHQSQSARECAGRLIHDRIARINHHFDEPIILLGDFNVGQQDVAWGPLLKAGLRDSLMDLYPSATNIGTFHAFRGKAEGAKIDAVLVSQHWQVEAAAINRTNLAGRYPSDHFPVTAALSLQEH